jgi:hypothetical protein
MTVCSMSWVRNITGYEVSCLYLSLKQAFTLRSHDVRFRIGLDAFWLSPCGYGVDEECYLVDPASSHMLVSKIKPCMCKYELIQTVKLRMAH